ncbi:MAG: hypothetical protein O3A96_11435 [Proteobacteria bacterium]|nr:hypothetical protein [Pseudomonadota bacterium]
MLRVIVAVCAAILLAGCYEVDSDFIGPDEAQFIAGLAGTFLPGNEYHYRRTDPDGSVSSGTFRAVWLHSNT